jgi:hypothetical protein
MRNVITSMDDECNSAKYYCFIYINLLCSVDVETTYCIDVYLQVFFIYGEGLILC